VYLIDTNVVTELRKRDKANQGVRAFFRQAIATNADVYLSVVTIGELRRGVELIRHRGDAAQAGQLDAWLGEILRNFAQNILPVDTDVSQVWGRLRVPHPEHGLDKLIAATALVHDLTVVTRNVNDFAKTRVPLLNPFS
jgi:predicted nucleic acid-binding protein